jgi:hypothetical protein
VRFTRKRVDKHVECLRTRHWNLRWSTLRIDRFQEDFRDPPVFIHEDLIAAEVPHTSYHLFERNAASMPFSCGSFRDFERTAVTRMAEGTDLLEHPLCISSDVALSAFNSPRLAPLR